MYEFYFQSSYNKVSTVIFKIKRDKYRIRHV